MSKVIPRILIELNKRLKRTTPVKVFKAPPLPPESAVPPMIAIGIVANGASSPIIGDPAFILVIKNRPPIPARTAKITKTINL